MPYAIPFREPYVSARGRLEARRMALLEIRGDRGSVGLGEAVPLSLRGGAPLERVVAELEAWGEASRGERIGWEDGRATPSPDPTLSAPARCAIETATLDLTARERGLPAWRLLTAESEPVEIVCNATLTSASPERVAGQARWWAQRGFRAFKLKVGAGGDLDAVEAVRSAIGEGGRIRIDANGTWDVDRAIAYIGRVGRFGIELIEQPVAGLEEMAEVAGAAAEAGIALVADESVASPGDARRAAELGSCDAATVKLSKIGGLAAGLDGHLPTYLSSALDGPIGIAAAAHAAQALPRRGRWAGVAHGLATQLLFARTPAVEGCRIAGGRLLLPPGPGLGVEVDRAALESMRLPG